jgi:putative hydrolase of the HAD superfamily
MKNKAIVFDLGGVIEEVYPNRVVEMLSNLGFINPEQFYSLVGQSRYCNEFETGHLSKDKFVEYVLSLSQVETTYNDIINAWHANQGGVKEQTLDVLQELKKHYDLYILSNTNEIHYEYICDKFQIEHGFDFESLFEGIYLSFQIGYRKPNQESFDYVFNQSIKNENKDISYIDDLHINCESAARFGVKTIAHQTNKPLSIDIFL